MDPDAARRQARASSARTGQRETMPSQERSGRYRGSRDRPEDCRGLIIASWPQRRGSRRPAPIPWPRAPQAASRCCGRPGGRPGSFRSARPCRRTGSRPEMPARRRPTRFWRQVFRRSWPARESDVSLFPPAVIGHGPTGGAYCRRLVGSVQPPECTLPIRPSPEAAAACLHVSNPTDSPA